MFNWDEIVNSWYDVNQFELLDIRCCCDTCFFTDVCVMLQCIRFIMVWLSQYVFFVFGSTCS